MQLLSELPEFPLYSSLLEEVSKADSVSVLKRTGILFTFVILLAIFTAWSS